MSLSSDEFKKAKEEFEALKQSMAQGLKIQKDMEKGLGNYAKALINIAEQQKNINYLEQQLAQDIAKVQRLKKEVADKEIANAKDIAMWQNLYQNGTAKIKALAEKKLNILTAQTNELKKQLDIEEHLVKTNEEYLASQKKNLEIIKQQAKEANKLLATWNSISKLPGLGKKWGFDKLKSWGIFEMDKEIRNAARSMNVGAKSFEGFSKNIGKAANTTVAWGVDTKKLAQMQQGYSEAIGRSVELTEEGHKAMALMAEGTGLGTEFAIQMASEMDKFGGSAKTAKDLVAGTVKQAAKMGVNGAAASKKLVTLLKMSQTYVFKGGQEGLKNMASDAERLKLDLEGAAGFAEKVMRPEGAVETAALLTTMGGEFAKLGDPFQLMFKARNDFAGFTKDLGKASSEFVEFNEQTGTFDNKGGLARDRMLEISKITGFQMDKLQEMAEAEKKLQMIQGKAPAGITSEEDKALIASLAEVGKGGKITIKLRGQDPLNIDQLTPKMLEKYKKDQITLEESALQARTFAEVVDDLFTSLKQVLVPFVQGLKEGLGKPIQNLMKDWNTNGFYEKLKGFGESVAKFISGIGGFVKTVGGFVAEFPRFSAALSAALLLLFGPGKWLLNGKTLGIGFNMVAGKGFGGMTAGGGIAAGYGQAGGMIGPALPPGATPPMGRMQRMLGGNIMGGKFAAGTMGSMAAGAGLGLAGMGLNSLRGDENSNFHDSTGGKLLGVGSSALSGAAMGMMLGPIGALVGGLLGAGYGAFNEFGKDDEPTYQSNDSLVKTKKPGKVKFNKQDKFMSLDDTTMIAGTKAGGLDKVAEKMGGGNGKDSGTKNINHTHTYKIIIESNIPGSNALTKAITDGILGDRVALNNISAGLKQSDSGAGSGKYGPKTKKPLN
jgi:hypothetical protein